VYVRSISTVVNLHDLWSNSLRSICHVIDLVCEKWGRGNLGASPNSGGHGLPMDPMPPVEAPLSL